MERYKFCVAVHLFLIEDDKILLGKRINTSYADGMYGLVAGHVDENENIYKAMVREAKEEANIDIKQEDLNIVQVMNMRGPIDEYIHYFFVVDKYSGNVKNMEEDKCEGLSWHGLDSIPSNTIDYIKYAIEKYLENKTMFTLYGY